MKRKPHEDVSTNPLERLLEALPALIAKQKSAAMKHELIEKGEWENYRQTVLKKGPHKAMPATLVIIKKHLGVTDIFFVGSEAEQNEEIRRIAMEHHKQTLFSKETNSNSISA